LDRFAVLRGRRFAPFLFFRAIFVNLSSGMSSSSLQVKPFSGGQSKIRNVEPMKEGKVSLLAGKCPTTSKLNARRVLLPPSPLQWIEVQKTDWTDEDGKDRVWEMAARKTTSEGGIDAVAVAALLKHPNRPVSIPM
jgi:hypothetical protein